MTIHLLMLWLLFAPVVATLCVIVGEIASAEYIEQAVQKRPDFYSLWLTAVLTTLGNIWGIGLPLHAAIHYFVLQHCTSRAWYIAFPLMIVTQHVLFHLAHYAMHRWLYRIHKFHHQYNETVFPASGIAVTVSEFLFAYSLPVIIGLAIARPAPPVLGCFLALEYACTIYVHSGFLSSKQYKYAVTPAYHCAHHSTCPNSNLAAPMFTFPDLMFDTQTDKLKNC